MKKGLIERKHIQYFLKLTFISGKQLARPFELRAVDVRAYKRKNSHTGVSFGSAEAGKKTRVRIPPAAPLLSCHAVNTYIKTEH